MGRLIRLYRLEVPKSEALGNEALKWLVLVVAPRALRITRKFFSRFRLCRERRTNSSRPPPNTLGRSAKNRCRAQNTDTLLDEIANTVVFRIRPWLGSKAFPHRFSI
jgi:hypothetical protein